MSGCEGLADLAHLDVVLDIAHIAAGIAEPAVVEPGEGVVLVEGLDGLHARFHIEDDQGHLQIFRNGMRQQGLARARLALDEQRHLELDARIHDLRELGVEHVDLVPVKVYCSMVILLKVRNVFCFFHTIQYEGVMLGRGEGTIPNHATVD